MKMLSLRALILLCALSVCSAASADPVVAVAGTVDAAAHEPMPGTGASASSEAIRAALEARGDERDAALREAVEQAYVAARFEPLWLASGTPSEQMRGLHRRLRSADRDGLDPADYAVDLPGRAFGDDFEAAAAADVAFSRAVARYVTDLGSGRVDPRRVSRIITLEPERPDVARLLPALARTAGISAALKKIEPPHPQYRLLRTELARLRANMDAPRPLQIPEGGLLKAGRSDERVPLLRERLGLAAAAAEADPLVMDEEIVAALRAFQESAGLNADGILGPRTLASLNGPDPQDLVDAIIANMERWRWAPRDLGDFFVEVNVPEFVVRVRRGGDIVHQTRVVVGTPAHKTPVFSDRMSHIVVNPYWNVPTSIVSNEMLPEIAADPYGYFDRQGYQVLAQVGGKMQVINPASVDWRRVDPRAIRIRQVPGERNALGQIKFLFPNQHSVYLHDTPSKRLFEKDYRAYSHGCVRVDDPLDFADALLPQAAPEWSAARMAKLFGGKERWITLDNEVPVHLMYFTVTVAADGTVSLFEDLYGFDRAFSELVERGAQG